ncbi:MAG: GGDEF domain-containing protein [Treponema sp.]|nr:GGDEF domain-containing protein [Treponema sp.]
MKRNKIRIGFVADYLNSEYSECLVSGITTCCKERNIELLIYQIGKIKPDNGIGHDYQFLAAASLVNEKNVDGIIISSGTQLHGMSKQAYAAYLRSYKPLKIVSIAHEIPTIPSIVCNAQGAIEALVTHLIKEQNCRKFGIMGVESDSKEMNLRLDSIKEVLKKNKISSSNIVVWKSNFHYASAYGILNDYYLKKKNRLNFDAIIALNDDLAFACMDFCTQRANLRIPEDIVVTGFDDMQRASFCTPSLTSVNQQVYYQGYAAARTLISQINCEDVPAVQVIDAKTILRESTTKDKNCNKQFNPDDCISFDLSQVKGQTDRFTVTEWFNKRQQVFQAAQMDAYIKDDLSLEKVGNRLTSQISDFGIQAAAVVLYDQPAEFKKPFEFFNLPEKAKLVSCFDYSNGGERTKFRQTVEFNPNETIIPEGYLDFGGDGLVTMALFRNSIQYGYILMRRGNFDTAVYDLIAKAVSIQIDESFEYSMHVKTKVAITEGYNIINEVTHIDYLTGLKNNRGFNELGETSLRYAEAMGQSGLILGFDVKDLTKINDQYGHAAGDRVIKTFADILSKHFRSNDIIARITGDKFAVISSGLTVDNYKKIKERITDECNRYSEVNGGPFDIGMTTGFVMFPSLKYAYNLSGLLTKLTEVLEKAKH